jgi:phytanoyl-CoA hydroxylase
MKLTCRTHHVALQDNYFLDSASHINFFFEEKAFNEAGQLQQAKELSINKIGHAMHDLDPVFR